MQAQKPLGLMLSLFTVGVIAIIATALYAFACDSNSQHSRAPAPVIAPFLLDPSQVVSSFPENRHRYANLCVMAVEIQRRRPETASVEMVAFSDRMSYPDDVCIFVTYTDQSGMSKNEYYFEKRIPKEYSKVMKSK